MLHLAKHLLKSGREIRFVAPAVLHQPVGVQQQNITGAHEQPFVHLVTVFEAQEARRRVTVNHMERRQHPDGWERDAQEWADLHEAVWLVREDRRKRMPG